MSNNPFSEGVYNTSPPTLSNGQVSPVQLDVNGNVKIASLPAGSAIVGQVEVTDGTNILGTSAHPVRVDPTGSTTQPVSGTVTVTQATGTNLHVVVDSAPTTAVTGTVTANAGTGTFATQDAADGSTGSAVPTKATLVGGSKAGSLTALLLDTSGNLNVNVAAGGGSGGTSSSFGSAFPATGTAAGASDGTNMKALLVDGSQNLKVTNTTAIVAGTNIIGKVGIDQTTPGTTNAVQDASDGPVSAGTAAGKSSLGALVAATAAPTPTVGQQIALQGDTSGNLRTSPYGATGSFQSKKATGTGVATATLTVPAATKWVLKGGTGLITVANSGAARTIFIQIADASANTLVSVGTSTGISAPINTFTGYAFGPGLPYGYLTTASAGSGIVSNNTALPMPELVLGPGFTIQFIIALGVVGDTTSLVANVMVLPD